MKRIFITLSALAVMAGTAIAQDSPLWLRRNDISPDGSKVVFNYKGNLYTVDTDGGDARQITSNPAYDTEPIWTPDGKSIVFASYREKGKDIFVIPADGGTPRRVTSHPYPETPKAVLNDGSILYTANIQLDAQYGDFPGTAQLYKVSAEGGRPEFVTSLPVSEISVSEGNPDFITFS